MTPIKTPFGLDITLELLYSCSNYNEFSYRNSFILHMVFAGLIQNEHTDMLSQLNSSKHIYSDLFRGQLTHCSYLCYT